MGYSIGISGFMGSGKSLGARYLSKTLGFRIFDGDLEAKMFMDSSLSIKDELDTEFGVVTNGVINYPKLSSIVFANNKRLLKLNRIVHPPLIQFIKDKVENLDGGLIIDAALIPLWQLECNFNKSIWIDSLKEIRINRVSNRNSISKEAAQQRIELQEEILLSPQKSIIIENNETIENLYKQLDRLVDNIE